MHAWNLLRPMKLEKHIAIFLFAYNYGRQKK